MARPTSPSPGDAVVCMLACPCAGCDKRYATVQRMAKHFKEAGTTHPDCWEELAFVDFLIAHNLRYCPACRGCYLSTHKGNKCCGPTCVPKKDLKSRVGRRMELLTSGQMPPTQLTPEGAPEVTAVDDEHYLALMRSGLALPHATLTHVPDYICDFLHRALLEVLREINSDPRSIKAHAKLALLAIAALSLPLRKEDIKAKPKKGQGRDVAKIKDRLRAILSDNDAIFGYVELLVKDAEDYVPAESSAPSTSSMVKAAIRKSKMGNYGGALQVLGSHGVAPQSAETKAKLEALFPSRENFEPLTDIEPPPQAEEIVFKVEQVLTAAMSFHSDTSPGPGGLRASHLKKLLSLEQERGQDALAEALTKYVNLVANGRLPTEIAALWSSSNLIALRKDPNEPSKIRPICVGGWPDLPPGGKGPVETLR